MDTRAKRLSALVACLGPSASLLSDPDGTIDQGDRATMCWTYRALTFGEVLITGGTGDWILYRRRRNRRRGR